VSVPAHHKIVEDFSEKARVPVQSKKCVVITDSTFELHANSGKKTFQTEAAGFGWKSLQMLLSPGGDYDRGALASNKDRVCMVENLSHLTSEDVDIMLIISNHNGLVGANWDAVPVLKQGYLDSIDSLCLRAEALCSTVVFAPGAAAATWK
jgi:hypothetical protein